MKTKIIIIVSVVFFLFIMSSCEDNDTGVPAYAPTSKPETTIHSALPFISSPAVTPTDEPEVVQEAFPNTVSGNFDSAEKTFEFVKYFLQMHEINKTKPDGASSSVDGIFNNHINIINTEYYINEKNDKICFVIYSWDFTYVTCIAGTINDFINQNRIEYIYDEKSGIHTEQSYDTENNLLASVSYKFVEGVPFPVITESYKADGYFIYSRELLNTSRFQLHEKYIIYDGNGKIIGYEGDINSSYIFEDYDIVYYRENYEVILYFDGGKLLSMKQVPKKEDFDWGHWEGMGWDYIGLVDISYRDDGSLRNVAHSFYSGIYGTSDSSGTAYFDNQGRMVHRHHYHTSGGYSYAWFYDETSRRPWAVVDWGGMYWSGIEELSKYIEWDMNSFPDWKLESAEKEFFYSYGCQTDVLIYTTSF